MPPQSSMLLTVVCNVTFCKVSATLCDLLSFLLSYSKIDIKNRCELYEKGRRKAMRCLCCCFHRLRELWFWWSRGLPSRIYSSRSSEGTGRVDTAEFFSLHSKRSLKTPRFARSLLSLCSYWLLALLTPLWRLLQGISSPVLSKFLNHINTLFHLGTFRHLSSSMRTV